MQQHFRVPGLNKDDFDGFIARSYVFFDEAKKSAYNEVQGLDPVLGYLRRLVGKGGEPKRYSFRRRSGRRRPLFCG